MHEITICVCTFRRPLLLARLLDRLRSQRSDPLYKFNIVVVDNDFLRSAWPIVEKAQSILDVPIRYFLEPTQSISLARNRAVANIQGDLVAFIDDDEYPDDNWLPSLVQCLDQYTVDGVLGPVKPHYEVPPPSWIIRANLCERPTSDSGTAIGPKDMRTGNALLKSELFVEDEMPFDPKWGTLGGEDTDFFSRMLARGHRFVWCNSAVVYESVPQERLRRAYFLRRALIRGLANSKKSSFFSLLTMKSLLAFFVYTLLLPVALIAGQHFFIRLFISYCDHIGRLLGHLGIRPVKERP